MIYIQDVERYLIHNQLIRQMCVTKYVLINIVVIKELNNHRAKYENSFWRITREIKILFL